MNSFQREALLIKSVIKEMEGQSIPEATINKIMKKTYNRISGKGVRSLVEIETQIDKCRYCSEHSLQVDTKPIIPHGKYKKDIDIMFISLYPTKDDHTSGKNFSDKSSEFLRKGIVKAKIGGPNCKIYAASLACCTIMDDKSKKAAINNCSPFIENLIATLSPGIIVPLGSEVTKHFLGSSINFRKYESQVNILGKYIVIPLEDPRVIYRMPASKDRDAAEKSYIYKVLALRKVSDRLKQLKEDKLLPSQISA